MEKIRNKDRADTQKVLYILIHSFKRKSTTFGGALLSIFVGELVNPPHRFIFENWQRDISFTSSRNRVSICSPLNTIFQIEINENE